MRISRTLRTHRPTYLADGSIDLYAPTSWRKMTQTQLRYVLMLLSMWESMERVKTYMLVRFAGIHIKGYAQRVTRDQPQSYSCWFRPAWWKPRCWFTLEAWQVQSFIQQFDFIDPAVGRSTISWTIIHLATTSWQNSTTSWPSAAGKRK